MKAITLALVILIGLGTQLHAQTKDSTKGKVGETVNKIGNKTAKVAVKATSAVTDKKYDSKVGPKGETVYINGDSRYYYVDGRGKKVFVSESDLKDKPAK